MAGRLRDGVGAFRHRPPRRHRGLLEHPPELGGRGPREMGAGRLHLRARGLARRRPFAGLHRPLLPARDQGFRHLHRMGGRAALVQRQGGPHGNLVLRHQPVARGGSPAQVPGSHVRLGGRGGLLPRHEPPGRHPHHVPRELVRHAGEVRAARPGRERPQEPRPRRSGLRPRYPERRRDGEKPLGLRRRHPRASARRRVVSGSLRPLGEDKDALHLGGELGRTGPPPEGQLRGLHAGGVHREMAGSPRLRALDGVLYPLRGEAPEAVLRPLSQGRGHRLDGEPPRHAQGAPRRREIRRAQRERMAPRQNAVDEVLSQPRIHEPRRRTHRSRSDHHLRGIQRRRDVHAAALRCGDGDNRPHGFETLRLIRNPGCGLISRPAPVHARYEGDHLPGHTRPEHAHRAGLAPRLAQKARARTLDGVEALPGA